MNAAVKKTIHDAADHLTEKSEAAGKAVLRAAEDAADEAGALKSRVLGATLDPVAQGLSSASKALSQHSVTDLTSNVKVLAKRHPGAFMAVAAVAGFALVRLVQDSARRR